MLIGEYRSKVGDKKRIAIPKKVRDELGDKLILTRGYEQSLLIVNRQMWEKVASEVITGSFINKNIRETSRFLIGSAVELLPDNQGRVVLPESLFEHASLKDEVVFVGLLNWVEIWDKTKWLEKVKDLGEKGEDIANTLIGNNNAPQSK